MKEVVVAAVVAVIVVVVVVVVVVVLVCPPLWPPPQPTANESTAAPANSAAAILGWAFISPSLPSVVRTSASSTHVYTPDVQEQNAVTASGNLLF